MAQRIIDNPNVLNAPKTLSFSEIDAIIRKNIGKATEENSSVWTCPDYNSRQYAHSFFQYSSRMIPAVQKKLIEIITEASPSLNF